MSKAIEFCAISHAERLQNPKLNKPEQPDRHFGAPYEMLSTEKVVEHDRVLSKGVVRQEVPAERNRGFRVSDFALENIIAAGALGSLRDMNLTGDRLNVADSVEGSVDGIIDAFDEAENNNEQTNEE